MRRGRWTAAAAAQARVVARMRERGHSLEELRRPGREGRLSFGLAEDLFPRPEEQVTVEEVAARDRPRAGADRAHPGHPRHPARNASGCSTRDDVEALRHCARVLAAGFPLVAFLQLVRVYVQIDAADRRRRGAAHPPLRPRADDPRRRARARDGRGDRRPRRRRAAAGDAADRVPAQPLPALLPRAGRRRPHGERARDAKPPSSARSRSRSASSTSPASPATPRRRATSRRSTWSRTSSPRSRRRCRPRRRS